MNYKKIIALTVVLISLYLMSGPLVSNANETYKFNITKYFTLKFVLVTILGIVLSSKFNVIYLKAFLAKILMLIVVIIITYFNFTIFGNYLLTTSSLEFSLYLFIVFGYLGSELIDKFINN